MAGGMDLGKLKALGGGKMPTPEQIEEAAAKLPGLGGPGSGGLGGPKLPGLGGLPGFNPFKK